MVNFKITLNKIVSSVLESFIEKKCICVNNKLIVFSTDSVVHVDDVNQIVSEFNKYHLDISSCEQQRDLDQLDIFNHLIGKKKVDFNKAKMFNILTDLPFPYNFKSSQKFAELALCFEKLIKNSEFQKNFEYQYKDFCKLIQEQKYKANKESIDEYEFVNNKSQATKWKEIKERLAEVINPKIEEEFLLSNELDTNVYSIQLYNSVKMYGAFFIKTSGNNANINDTIISFKYKLLENSQFKSSLNCVLWSLEVFEPYLFNKKFSISQYITNLNNRMNFSRISIANLSESTREIKDHLTLQDFNIEINIRRNVLLDQLCKYLECFYSKDFSLKEETIF